MKKKCRLNRTSSNYQINLVNANRIENGFHHHKTRAFFFHLKILTHRYLSSLSTFYHIRFIFFLFWSMMKKKMNVHLIRWWEFLFFFLFCQWINKKSHMTFLPDMCVWKWFDPFFCFVRFLVKIYYCCFNYLHHNCTTAFMMFITRQKNCHFLSFLSGSYLEKKFKVNEYYMHLNVNDDDNFWFFFLPVCSAVFFCSLNVDVNIFFYIAFIIVNLLLFVPRSSIYLSIF